MAAFLGSLRVLALAIALAAGLAAAVCPTNGDPRVVYVTANGDRGFHDILMLDTSGRPVGTAINWTSVPKTVVLRKLRGMALAPDGALLVASALGVHSKIVRFKAELEADCTRSFDRVVATIGPEQKYMKHPYSLLVVPRGYHVPKVGAQGNKSHPAFTLLTTNQNTISVTWMNGLDGTPIPAPKHTLTHFAWHEHSDAHGSRKRGGSAAAAEADANAVVGANVVINASGEVAQQAVATPEPSTETDPTKREYRAQRRAEKLTRMGVFTLHGGGEEAALSGGFTLESVRGAELSHHGKWLLIADVDADAVRVFELATGRYLWSIAVPTPIQIKVLPKGFLNLDGRTPEAAHHPHILVTTKTTHVYVAPLVSPGDAKAIADIDELRHPRRPGEHQRQIYIEAERRRSAQAANRVLAPRIFASGFIATSSIQTDEELGIVYIGDRVRRQIYRLRFDGAMLGPFGPRLKDQPEHVLGVTIIAPEDLPRCYELGATGLKYSVLCVAGWTWLALGVVSAGLFSWMLTGSVLGLCRGEGGKRRSVAAEFASPAPVVGTADRGMP